MTATISGDNLEAVIDGHGAELILLKNRSGKEYIWEGNPALWGRHSPVLFPVVGTLKNGRYTYNNLSYSLSRHGFARDMAFELKQQSADSATFSLGHSAQTLESYPFRFELQIVYTLTGNSLRIGYKIFNKDNKTMLFSIGAHPAFALPGNFRDYAIQFENDENPVFYLLENGLLSQKTERLAAKNGRFRLDYLLFERDALIFKDLKSASLTVFKNQERLFRVHFESFPYLGIWTKAKAPFICIEPWHGYSDTIGSNGRFAEKEGIRSIAENGIFESAFRVEIL